MSLINAIRFINVNYNNDNFRINNEIYYFDGQNALLNLDNGGGKTVMVQLIMAPFLQKNRRDLGNRKFASHFLTANPSFILVEWLLDGNPGHRVLTGMMVRKNQHLSEVNNNELEIINFVAEYDKEAECDIVHLPVVEKKDDQLILKSFSECGKLFEQFKKNRKLNFLYYDMNVPYQSKSYFEKIREFGINYKEWQEIIREVNKEEGGLSKIFDECKDERRLIEKWFLPKIQAKLTKEKKIPEELQHTVEEFLHNRHRLDATILQKDAIVNFQEAARHILDSCALCLDAKAREQTTRREFHAALIALNGLLGELQGKLDEEKRRGLEYAAEMAMLRKEVASLRYYRQEEALEAVRLELESNAETLVRIGDAILAQEEIRNLHACAVLQQQIDSLEAKRASLQAEDEVAKNRFREFDTELSELGGELKTYYAGRLSDYKSELDRLGREVKRSEETRGLNTRKLVGFRQDLELLAVQLGKLEVGLRNYEQREDDYMSTYKVVFADTTCATPYNYPLETFEGHAESLGKARLDLAAGLEKLRVSKTELGLKLKENDRQKADQNQLLKRAELDLARVEMEVGRFEQEIAVRKTILNYLDFGDDLLFETVQILAKHDTKIIELETLVHHLVERERELRNSLERYQHGFLNLSDEFKKLCERLGLPITYGFEWLKSQRMSLQAKEALLQRLSLLPYAIILDGDDLDTLKTAEPVETFTPVPIITSESLADPEAEAGTQQTRFYAHYDPQIFEAEYLAEKIRAIQAEIQKIADQIATRQEEINGFKDRKIVIQQQTLELKAYNNLSDERRQLEQTIRSHTDKLIALELEREELLNREQSCSQQIEDDVLGLRTLVEQEKVFGKLLEAYRGYLKAKQDYRHCQDGQIALKGKLAATQEETDELEQKLKVQLASQSELKLLVRNLQADKLSLYAAYHELPELQAGFEASSVEARYQTLLAAQNKHLNVNVNRIEAELKEVLRTLDLLRPQLEKTASEAGFRAREWQTRLITEAELEDCELQLRMLRQRRFDEQKVREQLNHRLGAEESNVNQAREILEKQCSLREPLPRETIRDLNFAIEEAKYVELVTQSSQKQINLGILLQKLNSSAVLYAEQMPSQCDGEVPELPGYFTLVEVKPDAIGHFLKSKEHDLQQSGLEQDRLKVQLGTTISEIYKDTAYEPIRDILPNLEPLAAYPEKIAKELPLKLQVFADLLHMMEKDLTRIEEEKQIIINLILDYIDNVQREFKTIDSNATIKIREQNKKILKIDLPDWEENKNLFKTKIRDYLEGLISQSLEALKKGENIHEPVGLALTTRELFDQIIGIPNVKIALLKVEAQRELLIPWNRVVTNSGGEGFLSAFIILSSLLSYMRNDENSPFSIGRKAGKTLIMDNPFGKTSAEHLLRPLIAIARINNLQLICLTALRDPAIYDRFDNIYILKLSSPNSQGVSYLKSSLQKGGASNLTQTRLQVMNSDESMIEDILRMEPEL